MGAAVRHPCGEGCAEIAWRFVGGTPRCRPEGAALRWREDYGATLRGLRVGSWDEKNCRRVWRPCAKSAGGGVADLKFGHYSAAT